MLKHNLIRSGFLIFLSSLNYLNGGFVCPSIVYGSWCYWTTTLETYNSIDSKCAENGGEFTYFQDIYAVTNLVDLFDNAVFLQNRNMIYVNVTNQSPGVWVFKDGREVPSHLWAAGEPPTDDTMCPFMSYIHSKYKLRATPCIQSLRGVCGRQLNVSNERFAVQSGKLLNLTGQTVQSRTIGHCSLACFQTSWCRSCNYNMAKQHCQLNYKTMEEEYLSYFVNEVDWNYIAYSVDN